MDRIAISSICGRVDWMADVERATATLSSHSNVLSVNLKEAEMPAATQKAPPLALYPNNVSFQDMEDDLDATISKLSATSNA